MELAEYLSTVEYDSTRNRINEEQIQEIETSFGIPIGPQLRQYCLTYGYLGKDEVEFYGVNSRQFLRSDLVTQTLYLHQYFLATKPFYAFENLDDGEYALVSSEDDMLIFDSENQQLSFAGVKLNEYIMRRFRGEIFSISNSYPEGV